MEKKHSAKVLIVDIETNLLEVYVFGLGDQTIQVNQVKKDSKPRILSFAAKWEDSKEIFQYDLRDGVNDRNEKKLAKKLWDLMDEADVVVGQNSNKFDIKKINDKFLEYKLGEPSPYQTIDTYVESKKYFSPISHKLEYRSEQLNEKYKKQKHSKYPGMTLWIACAEGIKNAFQEMAVYNKYDVLSTEEYFKILKPWIKTVNFSLFTSLEKDSCKCGSTNLISRGTHKVKQGIFKKYRCNDCGSWPIGKTNLLTKEQKKHITK